jgi:hypothetical protein
MKQAQAEIFEERLAEDKGKHYKGIARIELDRNAFVLRGPSH